MKKAIILSLALSALVSVAKADIALDGLTFNANNSALGAVYFDTVGATPADSTVKVDFLFGATSGSLTLASSVFTIQNGNFGYLNAGPFNVTTGSLGGGSAGFYQMRAWTGGATYSDVSNTKFGSSAITGITFGGTPLGGGAALPPVALNLHGSFAIAAVPEPATIALGLFGAAGLLVRRRK
jgi:PEP-CTERM motif